MLSHIEDLGVRTGQFAVEPLSDAEVAAVVAVTEQFYGPGATAAQLVPHEREADLRMALADAAPRLAELGQRLRALLESDYSGVVIPRFHLAHLDLDRRAMVLLALTLGLGRPTPTDRVERRIVWDVKSRTDTLGAGHVPTFSEHAYEADLHTDTQYFAQPERYLLLYFVKPAACGGGVSQLRDAGCLKARLAGTEDGRWALDLLSRQELPFRIPTTFTATRSPDTVEVTFARMFGTRPAIRFRTDTLARGLAVCPEYDTPELRKALAIVQAEVENLELRLDRYLDADSVLVVNNHETLHGRGEFSDHDRHAWRIRIADDVEQDSTRTLLKTA